METAVGAELLGGRFRAGRVIGESAGVQTRAGSDAVTGESVVIRMVRRASLPDAVASRIAHEARVLGAGAGSARPLCLDAGALDGMLYVVEPFVPGVTLEQRLRRGPLTLDQTLTVARCLLESLREVHAKGVLHRAVNPANIVVDGNPVACGTLINFVFSSALSADDPSRALPVATVRYMSPEQAGSIDRGVDERSDLYSLGLVLFECLAGAPPFQGSTLGAILRQHLSDPVPRLSESAAAIPRVVDDVLARLLAKDPSDRYASAGEALADVAAIVWALERGEADPVIVVGARGRMGLRSEPAFVGRRSELDALALALSAAAAGNGALTLVDAPSGGGKTRLLDEIARRASERGFLVLRGQGVDQAARRPLEMLAGMGRALAREADGDPWLVDRVRSTLGHRSAALAAALPELVSLLGAGRSGAGPEAFGEARTLEALEVFVRSLGTADRPALIILDDCQWADELTLRMLERLTSIPAQAIHVAVLAAYRTEEVADGRLLPQDTRADRCTLPPLTPVDIDRLVESMAGMLPDTVPGVVATLSDGNPFMASAVLRGLAESGALVPDGGGWRVDADAMDEAVATRHGAGVLERRLDLLPPEVLDVLSVGAVLGKQFDLSTASQVASMDDERSSAAIAHARHRQIVWRRGGQCAFVHDKLREAILARMDPRDRRRLHLAAARLLSGDDARIYDVAYHFDAAGDPARALPFALRSAREARARYALEVAEQQYAIAGRGAGDADRAQRIEIAEGLGDVLMLRGRYREALRQLEAARALAESDLDAARLDHKRAELAFKRGDLEASAAAAEGALRLLGERVPRRAFAFALWAVWEIVVQVAHSIAPRLFVGRRSDPPERELLAIRLYSRLAHVYWFDRGKVPTLHAHLREMNLAERFAPTPELAQAYSEHAPVMTLVPLYRRGVEYAERSYAIRASRGDAWGCGQSRNFHGIVLLSASRFEECIERCTEAATLLEQTGDLWELNIARIHIAFAHLRLGRLREAADEARRVHRAGLAIGDPQASGIGLEILAKATAGRIDEADARAECARPTRDVQLGAEVRQAEAVRLLGSGRAAEAAQVLEEAARIVRAAGLQQEYVNPVWSWLATAYRRQAEEGRWALAPERREDLARRALRAARRGVRLGRKWRNQMPHALRERGLAHALLGHRRRAARALERSAAVAERLGMQYERAVAAKELERFRAAEAGASDTARAEEAAAAVRAFEHSVRAESGATISLVDRMESILDAGRAIATSLTPAAVYEALRASSTTLLRGERSVVVEIGEDGNARAASGAPEFDALMVERVARSGVSDVYSADDGLARSGGSAPPRSALCVPIVVRGRVAACLYTEHRRVAGLFGTDETGLAGFIAAIAGAALENSEGFAEIEALTRSLEERVSERTAELEASKDRLDESLRELQGAYDRERDATQRLTRLDQLKTEFLGMVAHDLKTPMAAVSGFAETLRRRWPALEESKKREIVDILSSSSKRMIDFVDNLLNFARIESGDFTYEPHSFDILSLAQEIVVEMSGLAGDRRIEVRPGGDLPPALGDRRRTYQVLVNLVSNALKFSPPSSVVRIDLRRDGSELQVAVVDGGIGIAPGDLPRLFGKFARVAQADGGTRPGSGLGLYICRAMVEGQGGRIWVESELGVGTTVTFALPVVS